MMKESNKGHAIALTTAFHNLFSLLWILVIHINTTRQSQLNIVAFKSSQTNESRYSLKNSQYKFNAYTPLPKSASAKSMSHLQKTSSSTCHFELHCLVEHGKCQENAILARSRDNACTHNIVHIYSKI